MRNWVPITIVLTVNTFFHFVQAEKLKNLEKEVMVLQTIVGSTLCLGVEPIDNSTLD